MTGGSAKSQKREIHPANEDLFAGTRDRGHAADVRAAPPRFMTYRAGVPPTPSILRRQNTLFHRFTACLPAQNLKNKQVICRFVQTKGLRQFLSCCGFLAFERGRHSQGRVDLSATALGQELRQDDFFGRPAGSLRRFCCESGSRNTDAVERIRREGGLVERLWNDCALGGGNYLQSGRQKLSTAGFRNPVAQ
jgi:hypothetical protein